jgi:predicted lipoprotein with Yx(FWY)xxD motif
MLETVPVEAGRVVFETEIRRSRRTWVPAILIAGVAIVAGACSSGPSGSATSTSRPASSGSTPSSSTSAVVTVSTGKADSLGTVLVGPDGHTLYELTTEHVGNIECTGSCTSTWLPLTLPTGESAKLAAGVPGTISTVRRPEGTTQVTYDGHPLYYYASDTAPGQANGQGMNSPGIEGTWFVIAPAAASATTTPTTSPASSTTSTSTTSTSSGGYSY